jgi:hypothetical protein
MSARVVERLGKLHPTDRSWILHQLSPRERSVLMDIASTDTPPATEGPKPIAREPEKVAATTIVLEPADEIRRAHATRVVQVLQEEPAWLIATLMSIESWPWSADALQSMPATLRADVADLLRRVPDLTPVMQERLLARFVEGLKGVRGENLPSRWQMLASRVRAALVKKRLALRS